MFNIKTIKRNFKKTVGHPTNQFQSISLDLLKLWYERESPAWHGTISSKQYLFEHKELVISSGRQMGATTLLKVIQESYPSEMVIGVRVLNDARTHGFPKQSLFSLNLLKMATTGTNLDKRTAKQRLKGIVSGKTILMNMGKRGFNNSITNDMIDCLYSSGAAGILWLGQ